MKKYYVVFQYINPKRERRIGSTFVELNKKLNTLDAIKGLKEALDESMKCECEIITWKRLAWWAS